MQKQKLKALGIIFLLMAAISHATAEVTLVRFGPEGEEKPGIIDFEGQLRDLSSYVNEITPGTLSPASLEAIAELTLEDLPVVAGEPRLGVPLTGIGKIIAIGFNYINHAAEMEVQLPEEPLTFMKATSALTGPFDQIVQPRNGQKLDYEAELVVVIGSRAQYIAEETFSTISLVTRSDMMFRNEHSKENVAGSLPKANPQTPSRLWVLFGLHRSSRRHSGTVNLV